MVEQEKKIILSKLLLFLISDLAFAALLTVLNRGLQHGVTVLPAVLILAGILSLIMALVGFFCAVILLFLLAHRTLTREMAKEG